MSESQLFHGFISHSFPDKEALKRWDYGCRFLSRLLTRPLGYNTVLTKFVYFRSLPIEQHTTLKSTWISGPSNLAVHTLFCVRCVSEVCVILIWLRLVSLYIARVFCHGGMDTTRFSEPFLLHCHLDARKCWRYWLKMGHNFPLSFSNQSNTSTIRNRWRRKSVVK